MLHVHVPIQCKVHIAASFSNTKYLNGSISVRGLIAIAVVIKETSMQRFGHDVLTLIDSLILVV